MIRAAIQKISDMNGEEICCYVEPSNTVSINLQKSLGFAEKPTKPFNLLTVEVDIMFEYNIGQPYNVIPATADEARFVMMFYAMNKESLHGKYISLDEWKEILSRNDPDEQNFLICKGAMPVAWMRVNGLNNKDMAWISMLAVSDKYQRQGVGSFAVRFAEDFTRLKGFISIGIHTTTDNIIAQNCYKKLGYAAVEESECTTGDGEKRQGLTLRRDFIQYRQLSIDDLTPDMLKHFNRYQDVKKSWQKQNGEWVLVDNPHIGNWDEAKKHRLATDDFPQIINSGGALFCAFDGEILIGFSGIDGNFMGSNGQYLWLVVIHVSYEYRGKGIGRKLFMMTVDAAKKLGGVKLYISANSSHESQAFYRSIGCVDADEIMPDLFEAEPYDVHMEYSL